MNSHNISKALFTLLAVIAIISFVTCSLIGSGDSSNSGNTEELTFVGEDFTDNTGTSDDIEFIPGDNITIVRDTISESTIMVTYSDVRSDTTVQEFCRGWDKGYHEGYCRRNNPCVSPPAPPCPIPYPGRSRFEDGYNRGFLKGMHDAD